MSKKEEGLYKAVTHAFLIAILWLAGEIYFGLKKTVEHLNTVLQSHEVRISIIENRK